MRNKMRNFFGLGLSGLSKQLNVSQNQKVIKFNGSIYRVIGFKKKKLKTVHQSSLDFFRSVFDPNQKIYGNFLFGLIFQVHPLFPNRLHP